uniref:Uncharacterized protein n=1 Tax=Plectus sambesii TaxID=2011161 RepID=A0A914X0C2_9BILA
MATEDNWVTVRNGSVFPQQQGCIRALGIPGINHHCVCDPDAYIALWLRPDGEVVFGCAWSEVGFIKAQFPWDGEVVTGEEADRYRILKCSNDTPNRYHWVQASQANEHSLLYVGEYTPALVLKGNKAIVGKACWDRKMAWTCEGGESCYQGGNFSDCYLLAKE